MTRSFTRAAAPVLALLLAGVGASCAKSNGSTAPGAPEEPPATATDGAPVFPVPADAEAAIERARLHPVDAGEPRVMRLRAHLDVFINGRTVTVPEGIGVVDEKRASPLFTADDSGVLHVASTREEETIRLGQLFQQWNVALDKDCVAGFCVSKNEDKQLLAFVDGELAADPSTIHLTDGSEIVVWYGDRGTNPNVPTTYTFPG